MMHSRNTKPKLTLSVAAPTTRPALSIKSAFSSLVAPLSPRSPLPNSPTALNTKLNQRGFTTLQPPTYAYANHSSSRSILKKSQSVLSAVPRRLQFSEQPVVHTVTPIEEEDYYGAYRKMTRDERRWQPRP